MKHSYTQITSAQDALFYQFVKENMDVDAYLEAYPDVHASGLDPVEHWLEYGMVEGRFLYPASRVVFGEYVDHLDNTLWRHFTWHGRKVAVRSRRPISPAVVSQIEAQARHDHAVLAVGTLPLGSLRQLDGNELHDRIGLDVRSIFATITERPDMIVLLHCLGQDALEKYAADFIGSLSALERKKILVIVTDETAQAALGWESISALTSLQTVSVVFWQDISGPGYGSTKYLARLINAIHPQEIMIINTHIGFDMIASFGRGLSKKAKIYSVYFSHDAEGAHDSIVTDYLRRTMQFSLWLTDNNETAATLRRQCGDVSGPGIKVLPAQLKTADTSIFSARLAARKCRVENSRAPFRWAWVPQSKNPKDSAILAEIARIRPADQFYVFGDADASLDEMGLALPNIVRSVPLKDAHSADFNEYDGFFVTGLVESLPNIVLEMSQHAIPMVLSDVRSLRETFDDNSVLFVQHTHDIHSTAKAFSTALDCVVNLSVDETLAMINFTHDQALIRHASDVYLKNVADIFEIAGNHV